MERTPEAALSTRVKAEEIRKVMATLPVPFREVLVLREIHGLDYRAIAEIAELPLAPSCRSLPAPVASSSMRSAGA